MNFNKFFFKNGYAILDIYNSNEFNKIQKFSIEWVKKTINFYSITNIKDKNLSNYHLWFKKLKLNHPKIFQNPNRVIEPSKEISNLILNKKLKKFIAYLIDDYDLWRDPGLGWLCYRFIRPNFNDGYHLCKKSWGEANKVLSVWLPTLGFEQNQMIQLLPGSHKKKIPFIRKKTKFVEPAVNLKHVNVDKLIRPKLKKGQLLIYHPNILHSENVIEANSCRINLEFRFNPK